MKKWFWNKQDRVFVDAQGNELSDRELRQGIDAFIESNQKSIADEVATFAAGAISVFTLFQFLDEEISAMHGAAGSIAYGGLVQMDSEKWARIDANLQQERTFLMNFKSDVEHAAIGTQEVTQQAIASRAELYAEAAYSEWQNQVVQREQDNGATLGRRICEADGASCEECVGAATEEFIPLDEIPEIGSLQCMNNCRCEIEFSIEGVQFSTSDLFQGVIGGSPEVLQ